MTDGRYVTITRHHEPDDDRLSLLLNQMREMGVNGWLAIMSQSVHHEGIADFIMVRELGQPSGTFEDAALRLRKLYGRDPEEDT